jgi:uncharacterized protein (DUF305 family)
VAGSSPTADAVAPEEQESAAPRDGETRRPGLAWLAAVAVVLLALAGFAGYQLGAASAGPPADDSADAGFARDMQTHHNQAVQMSMIIRDKTTDPTLRTLAYDIATSQQQQSGQMFGWLVLWGLPQTASEPPMQWMSSSAEHGTSHSSTADPDDPGTMVMPGLATAAELRTLEQATGTEAERQFLTLMIRHHEGGVDMAEAAIELAERREVRGLAQAIVTAQSAEITLLNELLQERS